MPNENIIYFGDTAHLPYGDKSASAVAHYSEKIAAFLTSQNAKTIVIACNTASSFGYHAVLKQVKNKIPVVNVIDPMAQFVSTHKNFKKVGVIGTKGTISSHVYRERIKKLSPNLKVVEIATPLLAPLVEENFYNTTISKLVLAEYFKNPELTDIDSLVLGCTHYPLLKDDIAAVLGEKVTILDSSEVIAQQLKKLLEEKNLLGNSENATQKFFVSDFTETFDKNARMFFGHKITLAQANIWQ